MYCSVISIHHSTTLAFLFLHFESILGKVYILSLMVLSLLHSIVRALQSLRTHFSCHLTITPPSGLYAVQQENRNYFWINFFKYMERMAIITFYFLTSLYIYPFY